ncbi:hypothetical protein [Burkholderia stagnalis]
MNFHEANQRVHDFPRAAARPWYGDDETAMDMVRRLAHREAAPGFQARFPPGEECRRIAMKTTTGPLIVNHAEPANSRSAISGSPVANEPLETPFACA